MTRFPLIHRLFPCLLGLFLLPSLARAAGVELVVELPKDLKVKEAQAVVPQMKLEQAGSIKGNTITFANLLPNTAYNVKLTLPDGVVLQGVDMSWYDLEPAKPNARDLTDDDREEIRSIVQDVQSFYNKSTILRLTGTHDRAVGLVELVRDKDFHAGKGEVIWRVELYYFKFQAGGWEKVSQQNKVLVRERFKTNAAYQEALRKARWVPELGGLRIGKDETGRRITLPPAAVRGTGPDRPNGAPTPPPPASAPAP